MVLRLARRKNKPFGSVIRRDCWCQSCRDTCPVHSVLPWLNSLAPGATPFAHFTQASALAALRKRLAILQIEHPQEYKLHDFRRGHAQDLLEAGASLMAILKAGEWKGAAFMAYLDSAEMEARAVLQTHMQQSSDEEDGA